MRIDYKEPHHISKFTESEARVLLNNYLSDYYSVSDDPIIIKHLQKQEISHQKLTQSMKNFKQRLSDEVYKIINYSHYLINAKVFRKTDTEHLCIIVLAFRLSAINEQQTILKAIKRVKKAGKKIKREYVIDASIQRALVLAKEILYATMEEERSFYTTDKEQTGGIRELNKLFQSIYERGEYRPHEWVDFLLQVSEFIAYTNAPSDFTAIKDFIENHQAIQYLTYGALTQQEQIRCEHFDKMKKVEQQMRLFHLPHIFHYPSELIGQGFSKQMRILPPHKVIQKIIYMQEHFKKVRLLDEQMQRLNLSRMFHFNTALDGKICTSRQYATHIK